MVEGWRENKIEWIFLGGEMGYSVVGRVVCYNLFCVFNLFDYCFILIF